jgi:hypothetical protein
LISLARQLLIFPPFLIRILSFATAQILVCLSPFQLSIPRRWRKFFPVSSHSPFLRPPPTATMAAPKIRIYFFTDRIVIPMRALDYCLAPRCIASGRTTPSRSNITPIQAPSIAPSPWNIPQPDTADSSRGHPNPRSLLNRNRLRGRNTGCKSNRSFLPAACGLSRIVRHYTYQ